MAATLALTSSGNISPVSDLGVVPSDGSPGSPLMAATLALAPGLERLLTLSQGRISVCRCRFRWVVLLGGLVWPAGPS